MKLLGFIELNPTQKKAFIFSFIGGFLSAIIGTFFIESVVTMGPEGPVNNFGTLVALSLVMISFDILTLVYTGRVIALVNSSISIAMLNGFLCAIFGYLVALIAEKTKLTEKIKPVWLIILSIVVFELLNIIYFCYSWFFSEIPILLLAGSICIILCPIFITIYLRGKQKSKQDGNKPTKVALKFYKWASILSLILLAVIILALSVTERTKKPPKKTTHTTNYWAEQKKEIESLADTQPIQDEPTIKMFKELYNTPIFLDKPGDYPYRATLQTIIYGRYVLNCMMSFNINKGAKTVSGLSEPIIKLYEIDSVRQREYDGSFLSCHKKWSQTIEKDVWNKIIDNKGDISKVIPGIVIDQPVKGIDRITGFVH